MDDVAVLTSDKYWSRLALAAMLLSTSVVKGRLYTRWGIPSSSVTTTVAAGLAFAAATINLST